MKLLTKKLTEQLLKNGQEQEKVKGTEKEKDFFPVVKLFSPEGQATWLLTEIDPENPAIAFGLCDLGLGFPELGYASLEELRSIRTPRFGLPIERDLHFKADKPLSEYTKETREKGYIQT